MSSPNDIAEAVTQEGRIIHFDATLRRREKMKRQASAEASGNGHHVPEPPRPAKQAPSAPATIAKSGQKSYAAAQGTNGGHGVHAGGQASNGGPATVNRVAGFSSPAVANGPAAPPKAAAPVVPDPQTPPAVAGSAPAAPALEPEELERFLINFVVEQTGYPPEMVELDADLEADLGIDSIKKAQLFGEMAETLSIQVEITDDLSLDDFPTLRHVMEFLLRAGVAADTGERPSAPPNLSEASSFGTQSAGPQATPSTAPQAPGPHSAPATAPATAPPAGDNSAVLSAAIGGEELEQFLINFVVEQTGYPPEMVELDADLEADLGIDSIKKAQLFGELAETLHVQVEITDDMSLDDFPTLRHVLDFLKDNGQATVGSSGEEAASAVRTAEPPAGERPQPAPPVAAAPAVTPVKTAPAPPMATAETAAAPSVQMAADLSPDELEQFLINFVVEQTGYPPEMVELDADLEADLGIDSIKKAQLFGELAETLHVQVEITDDMSLDDFPTLRHVLDFLAGARV